MNGNRFGRAKLTKTDDRAQAKMRLVCSTDERFAALTAEDLARQTGLTVAWCREAIEAERMRRAALAERMECGECGRPLSLAESDAFGGTCMTCDSQVEWGAF